MLFHFIYPLSKKLPELNVFKYITTRSFLAFTIALLVAIWVGKHFIRYMKNKQFGQFIREDGPQAHMTKQGTPTFGGVFIVFSCVVAMLFCGNFFSAPLLMVLGVGASFFTLGFIDDYLKVMKKNNKGVSGKLKLVWQFGTSITVVALGLHFKVLNTDLYVPFIKGPIWDMGPILYTIFASFVIVGSSNAVNLTDGLDGLVTGPVITSASTLALLAYLAGNIELSSYLYIPYISMSGELVVLLAAILGASVGFLWYNSYPAQIFMGDVGSLSLGGVLGSVALVTKNEILFCLIGGIFVIEALSVIIQVISFKTRKKRVFKMAPLHHHFELLGWKEPKVIVRFWIVSILFAILALATLKLR